MVLWAELRAGSWVVPKLEEDGSETGWGRTRLAQWAEKPPPAPRIVKCGEALRSPHGGGVSPRPWGKGRGREGVNSTGGGNALSAEKRARSWFAGTAGAKNKQKIANGEIVDAADGSFPGWSPRGSTAAEGRAGPPP